MVESIIMRNCATYDEKGVEMHDCRKINFIYGSNGSGKTTISNFFQNMNDKKFENCQLIWRANQELEKLVYNRKFKEDNFSGDIEGVFTLGKATIDERKEIEKLKEIQQNRKDELDKYKKTLEDKKKSKEDEIKKFQNDIWYDIFKKNEKEFNEAFTGLRSSKNQFYNKLINEYNNNHDYNTEKYDLIKRKHALFADNPQICNTIEFTIEKYLTDINAIEHHKIWQKHIIGNQDVPIAKLINSLGNSDWVKSGVEYIKENGICPFCQQKTIDDKIRQQLEAFFNKEYGDDINTIASLINNYKLSFSNVINFLQEILRNDVFINVSEIDCNILKSFIEKYKLLFSDNIVKMDDKKREPGNAVIIETINFEDLKILLSQANDKVILHNNMISNIKKEKEKLILEIWSFLVKENERIIKNHINSINKLEKAIEGISKKVKNFEDEIQKLELEIVEKNKNITSVQPTVDEINRLLKAYGFENFKIVPSEKNKNTYQIQRPDGSLAQNTLSEGEETFISFLYFLQLTKGATDISRVSSEKILIIDDPICSLDSTILYIVSTLVKDLIDNVKSGKSNIKQIFILTHNVFFHKEASFSNGKAENSKDVSYWMIYKDTSVTRINAYGQNNPIHTSYELLWKELETSCSMSIITIQNTMRRIIENYFGMLGNRKYDYLTKQFVTAEEQKICQSLFYWVNDGSHSIPDDLYIDSYTDSVEKYKKVFHEVFVKSGHEAHYNMMMGITDKI